MKKLTLLLSMMIALVGFNANAAMYIVGTINNWDPGNGIEMTDNGDGTYTYETIIDGSALFVFGDGLNSNWNIFNSDHRYGPANGDNDITLNQWIATSKAGDHGAYKFIGDSTTYVFTFDENTKQFKVEGNVTTVTFNSLTVAGSSTALFGTTWDPANADNDMTLDNGLYTWKKENVELTAGAFEFKVVADHDTNYGLAWPSSNYHQPIEKHGYYDVTITFNAQTNTVNCVADLKEEIIDEEDPIYTVAGTPAALFGTEWAPALVDNEMTKGQDGIYTWKKDNVALTAGNVEFKVVQGHDWGIEYPSSNYVAAIDSNGVYNVTITFNPDSTKEITFNASIVEPVDDFYAVAGEPAKVFGEEWNPGYAANYMTLVDGLYTWTKDSVELTTADKIEFKVVKNANWTTCWPENNVVYNTPEDGVYDMTITYNPENDEVLYNFVKQGGEEPPVEITVYTVVGPESIFGSNWNAADTNNDMVMGEDSIYTWTKDEVALYGSFGFKIVGNHDYAVYEWPIGMDNNYIANLTEGEGLYSIVITFNPNAGDEGRINYQLTRTGDIPPMEHTYTVAGTDNLFGSFWDAADADNDMVKGEDGIYTWKKENVVFEEAATIEFKVVQDHNWDYAWPSSNWVINDVTEAGTYNFVITFNPAVDDADKITVTVTKAGEGKRGDVNGDGNVDISDATTLINYLLTGSADPFNEANANCDLQNNIDISDATTLINFLLNGTWPE
ncbi:MAG: hypothetical protein IJS04_04895 [Muribaculaceae bacterium]|nr:hypothetical protein [Muribaculaceae bacterium]MBQ7205163.1 hypothetical protein [Muribaculaceae bacterium]